MNKAINLILLAIVILTAVFLVNTFRSLPVQKSKTEWRVTL